MRQLYLGARKSKTLRGGPLAERATRPAPARKMKECDLSCRKKSSYWKKVLRSENLYVSARALPQKVSLSSFLCYPQSSFHVLKGTDNEKIHWSHLLAGRGRYLGYYLMDQLYRRQHGVCCGTAPYFRALLDSCNPHIFEEQKSIIFFSGSRHCYGLLTTD